MNRIVPAQLPPVKSRLKTYGVLTFVALSISTLFAESPPKGSYPITNFEIEAIGGKEACFAAVQGPDGRMYFGSNVVLSYDGERWRTYQIGRAHV